MSPLDSALAWLGTGDFCLALSATAYGQSVDEYEWETLTTDEAPAADKEIDKPSTVAQLIIETTNDFRCNKGVERVRVSPQLAETAQNFTDYMAENDSYGHTADGNRPAERATKHGYDYCLVSENIAYQFSSVGFAAAELAERVTFGWKESPGHRKKMLDPDVIETARSGATGYWYAV